MAKVCVFLAEGFEEIEALTVVDLLRRDRLDVALVSVDDSDYVNGSHSVTVKADLNFSEVDFSETDMFVLPGGAPGTQHLKENEKLCVLLQKAAAEGKRLAAICAAPSVLGKLGLLQGKHAVCYPGYEAELTGAIVEREEVMTDGNITTSRGMGTSIAFALELIKLLDCETEAGALKSKIIYKQ
ncbi:MAG: DJ-1/PfpI family protein [Clostridia bacterium]|nr:DJ-1/PfpI family protein [Clostridia bacterium]